MNLKTLKQIKETWDVLVPVGSGKRFMMISPQVMESRQFWILNYMQWILDTWYCIPVFVS